VSAEKVVVRCPVGHPVTFAPVCIVCRWNSGRSQVKLTVQDTLFEGFDCEDSVQSFVQIVQTAMKHKDALLRCAHVLVCGQCVLVAGMGVVGGR